MYRCSRGVFHLVFSGTPLSYLTRAKHVARYVYTGTVRDVRYMAPHGCQTGTTPSRGMAHPLHTVIIGGPRHDEVDLVDISLLWYSRVSLFLRWTCNGCCSRRNGAWPPRRPVQLTFPHCLQLHSRVPGAPGNQSLYCSSHDCRGLAG